MIAKAVAATPVAMKLRVPATSDSEADSCDEPFTCTISSSSGMVHAAKSIELRAAVDQLWPLGDGGYASSLKRDIVLLLLEDQDLRMGVPHVLELLRSRQRGRNAAETACSATLLQDLLAQPDLQQCTSHTMVGCDSSGDSATNPALTGVLRLNVQKLIEQAGRSSGERCGSASVPDPPLSPHTPCKMSSGATATTLVPATAALPGQVTRDSATAIGRRPQRDQAATAINEQFLSAVKRTWPNYSQDDDQFLAAAISYVLITKTNPRLQLPHPFQLHLSDVGTLVRSLSMEPHNAFGAAFPRQASAAYQAAIGKQPRRITDLLQLPEFAPYFHFDKSPVRHNEQLVALNVDRLLGDLVPATSTPCSSVAAGTQPGASVPASQPSGTVPPQGHPRAERPAAPLSTPLYRPATKEGKAMPLAPPEGRVLPQYLYDYEVASSLPGSDTLLPGLNLWRDQATQAVGALPPKQLVPPPLDSSGNACASCSDVAHSASPAATNAATALSMRRDQPSSNTANTREDGGEGSPAAGSSGGNGLEGAFAAAAAYRLASMAGSPLQPVQGLSWQRLPQSPQNVSPDAALSTSWPPRAAQVAGFGSSRQVLNNGGHGDRVNGLAAGGLGGNMVGSYRASNPAAKLSEVAHIPTEVASCWSPPPRGTPPSGGSSPFFLQRQSPAAAARTKSLGSANSAASGALPGGYGLLGGTPVMSSSLGLSSPVMRDAISEHLAGVGVSDGHQGPHTAVSHGAGLPLGLLSAAPALPDCASWHSNSPPEFGTARSCEAAFSGTRQMGGGLTGDSHQGSPFSDASEGVLSPTNHREPLETALEAIISFDSVTPMRAGKSGGSPGAAHQGFHQARSAASMLSTSQQAFPNSSPTSGGVCTRGVPARRASSTAGPWSWEEPIGAGEAAGALQGQMRLCSSLPPAMSSWAAAMGLASPQQHASGGGSNPPSSLGVFGAGGIGDASGGGTGTHCRPLRLHGGDHTPYSGSGAGSMGGYFAGGTATALAAANLPPGHGGGAGSGGGPDLRGLQLQQCSGFMPHLEQQQQQQQRMFDEVPQHHLLAGQLLPQAHSHDQKMLLRQLSMLQRVNSDTPTSWQGLLDDDNSKVHMAMCVDQAIQQYHERAAAATVMTGGLGGNGMSSGGHRLNHNSSAGGGAAATGRALLQRLPPRVTRRLEELVARSRHVDWKHFDAGVVKVLAQLCESGDEDVFEELDLLESTDLSGVEYMPAYLNKRLNNKLWSRRKATNSQLAAGMHGSGGGGGSMGLSAPYSHHAHHPAHHHHYHLAHQTQQHHTCVYQHGGAASMP